MAKSEMEKAQRARAAADLADAEGIWGPLAKALGAELSRPSGEGLGRAPWGHQADPSAGARAQAALVAGLRAQLGKMPSSAWDGALDLQKSAREHERRMDEQSEVRRCMAMAAQALELAAECGMFEQALRAAESAQELPIAASQEPMRMALLRGAMETGRAGPQLACERLLMLDASGPLWSPQTAWAKRREESSQMFDSLVAERMDAGHWASELIKAASLRPECGGAAARLLSRLVEGQPHVDWNRVGEQAGEAVRWRFVRAGSIPAEMKRGLPADFWLGMKSSLGPSSKLGAELLGDLLEEAQADLAVRAELCAGVWMGLVRKEIDAFESRFPGWSAGKLGPAIEAKASKSAAIAAMFRLEKGMGKPSGSWARKAFEARGLSGEALVYGRAGGKPRGEELREAFEALASLREAKLIKESLPKRQAPKAAAKAKAKAKGRL